MNNLIQAIGEATCTLIAMSSCFGLGLLIVWFCNTNAKNRITLIWGIGLLVALAHLGFVIYDHARPQVAAQAQRLGANSNIPADVQECQVYGQTDDKRTYYMCRTAPGAAQGDQ